MFKHGFLGFCAWDIPALIVLAAIIVIFIIHRRNMKKCEQEFEEELVDMQNSANQNQSNQI